MPKDKKKALSKMKEKMPNSKKEKKKYPLGKFLWKALGDDSGPKYFDKDGNSVDEDGKRIKE